MRFHSDREPGLGREAGPAVPGEGSPERGRRLNLLVSYAGWQADPWVERLPKILEPMGVRAFRASTGREASDVIRRTPIHAAVVDLGLPIDGEPEAAADEAGSNTEGGVRLLEILRRLETSPPVVVVKAARSVRDDQRVMAASLRAGAFAVVDRPHSTRDLELLLDTLRRLLTRHYEGRWPGMSAS
ncbi:MAG: response regulator [Planctomycetota bacterium]